MFFRFPYDEVYEPNHVYIFHITCIFCKAVKDIELPAEGVFAYGRGALVQNAFPDVSPADRDMLIMAVCGDCP